MKEKLKDAERRVERNYKLGMAVLVIVSAIAETFFFKGLMDELMMYNNGSIVMSIIILVIVPIWLYEAAKIFRYYMEEDYRKTRNCCVYDCFLRESKVRVESLIEGKQLYAICEKEIICVQDSEGKKVWEGNAEEFPMLLS